MEILLPPKKGEVENVKLNFEQLVVVGANGAGKTRFGSWIEENNYEKVHRISAQKSLSMPSSVSTTSIEIAVEDLLYGMHYEDKNWLKRHGRKSSRWNHNLNTSLLNDYDKLMVLLHSEEYEKSVYYKDHGGEKPITKLDKIQRIWESVLPHRKLEKRAGVIDAYQDGHPDKKYNGSEMSDGERCIFYLIGEVLCAPEKSIIIIDEPEMHIHVSLIKRLFDLIENERPDCVFIYLTHSIDFAFSRQNAKKIWAKSYEDGKWDYEILNGAMPIPEQLYLEVLGSRLPVIFIEGDDSSIDYEIYSLQSYKDGIQEDLRPIKRATIEDLDKEKISNYLEKVKKDKPNFSKFSDEKILKLSGIIENSTGIIYPTLSGIMMFGEYPQGYLPQLFVACVVVPGTKLGDVGEMGQRFDDNKRVEGTLDEMLDQTLTFIRRNIGTKVIIDNNEVSKNDIFISTDSVRPMVRKEELLELIKKSKKYNAVTIVNPIIENIVKLNEDGEIEQIFKREKLFKDLSPQAFNIQKFTECLKKIDKEQLDKITDLSELFINCKEKVATIVGNTDNIKITTPIDIKIVNELIKKEEV